MELEKSLILNVVAAKEVCCNFDRAKGDVMMTHNDYYVLQEQRNQAAAGPSNHLVIGEGRPIKTCLILEENLI